MHRALLLLVPLAACATRDVHRSEPLVARATCSGDGLAVFGYPYEQEADCGERVVHLGDGCYLATRPGEKAKAPRKPRQVLHGPGNTETHWVPHLFECAANAPDGHVACVEDSMLARRGFVFGEDIMRISYGLRLPNHVGKQWPFTWMPATGRCRDKLEAWEIANLPPPDRRTLISTYWHRIRDNGRVWMGPFEPRPHASMLPIEDPISLDRILDGDHAVRATVCPAAQGLSVTIDNDFPAQLEHQFADMVKRGLADRTFEECEQLQIGLAFAADDVASAP